MLEDYWGEPFARKYMELEGKPPGYRIAAGLKEGWTHMPLSIKPEAMLVGHPWKRSVVGFKHGAGLYCNERLASKWMHASDSVEVKNHLRSIVDYFTDKTTQSVFAKSLSDQDKQGSGMRVFWAGGWGGHTLLDYDLVLTHGISGIRHMILEHRKAYEDDTDVYQWYEALLLICDAICIMAERFADLASEQAKRAPRSDERKRLNKIAEICRRVPLDPAETWHEALQAFWFIYVFDGIDSPGRFDQYMYPYYKKSIESGEMSQDEARHLLEELWVMFHEVRAWNLCVGGQTPDGQDATNELSYLILDIAERFRFPTPNLTMRCHKGTPETLWDKACKVIATGIGMPALYNDEVVIPALLRFGIALEDARDYAINGCNQIDIQGKSHMGLEDGEFNLLKCVELALFDGYCHYSGEQIGPHTGKAEAFTCFEEFMQAYKTQVEYFTNKIVNMSNVFQKVYAETAPDPIRSLLVKDCIAKGRNFKSGGPRYNHGQILTQGIANAGNSLFNIKKLVFEEKRIKMSRLKKILLKNFEGHEALRQLMRNTPKYGNDHEEVDAITKDILEHFFNELTKYNTFRGGRYGGGSSVFVRGPEFGLRVGATPDGRLKGEPLADSVGPAQGTDKTGPTAVLNSVAKIDHTLALSGYVLNMKFAKRDFSNPETLAKFKQLVKAFFKSGGQQIQVNAVDSDTLREAREHPEKHFDLVVRVGGFSTYFTTLSTELQDEIISRTEQMF